jgi:hypothetical protein
MHTPVTPWVLAGRIFAIIGMAFTAACAILFLVVPLWWWALGSALAFAPFFLLMCIAVALVTVFPGIATWLPSTMFSS